MAIVIDASEQTAFSQDHLSGASRTNVIDRWIFVFTAASFIAVVLTGFIPNSVNAIATIRSGLRPPFPVITHIHAVLMGSFLLLLLGQTVLVAIDKRDWHMRLGLVSAILFPALVIAALILVPTIYHTNWNAAQTAPEPARQQFRDILSFEDNILLFQLREGILFPILMWIALRARVRDLGLHKRLIFLATAPLLSAAFDRIHWLPTTFPLGSELYTLLAVAPMFIWDLTRNRGLHRAYLIFAAFYMPLTVVVHGLWDTPWWHAAARHIMGV